MWFRVWTGCFWTGSWAGRITPSIPSGSAGRSRFVGVAVLVAVLSGGSGCQPLPGTQPFPGNLSPGFGSQQNFPSRLGMVPQNRAIGNTAFNPIGFGESAYGRVGYGPGVTTQGLFGPLIGGGDNRLTQAPSSNSGAGFFGQITNVPFGNPVQGGNANGNGGNPFTAGVDPNLMAQNSQQLQNLSQQVNRFNVDNNDLYRQVATLQQQLQSTNDTNSQLRQQLTVAQTQMQQMQQANQEAQQRLQLMQTSASTNTATGFNGATIRANNSLMRNIEALRIPGTTLQQDNDVIRVIVPSDFLFQAGNYNIQPASTTVLNQVAAAIRQYYPSQIVGVESHWDSQSLGNTVSQHQVTTGQALAVLNHLTGQAGMPSRQLFVMGYGANRPKYSNASPQGQSANRRIEIVVYPETF